MKPLAKIAAGCLACLAVLAAAPAMARVDVGVNIGVPGGPPPVYVSPPPSYVSPPPQYLNPPPGPVYLVPPPVYAYPPPGYYGPPRWEDRRWHDHGRHWDRDRDGVPNRQDRWPDDWRRR